MDFSPILDPYRSKLTEVDIELVEEAAVRAEEIFYPRDVQDMEIKGVEDTYTLDGPHVTWTGYIDLWGKRGGTYVVYDWKTRDAEWTDFALDRLRKSDQHKEYALRLVQRGDIPHDFGSLFCFYRCYSWPLGKFVQISVEVDSNELAAYEQQIEKWAETKEHYNNLYSFDNEWPLNTNGCKLYGPRYPCKHTESCFGGSRKVQPTVELATGAANRPMSYSSLQVLKRCPELYRLDRLERVEAADQDNDRAIDMGHLFHECMEKLYKQEVR